MPHPPPCPGPACHFRSSPAARSWHTGSSVTRVRVTSTLILPDSRLEGSPEPVQELAAASLPHSVLLSDHQASGPALLSH